MKILFLIILRLVIGPIALAASVLAGYWYWKSLNRQMWEEREPGPAPDYELTPEEEMKIYRGVMQGKDYSEDETV